jgi:hypothetical protein
LFFYFQCLKYALFLFLNFFLSFSNNILIISLLDILTKQGGDKMNNPSKENVEAVLRKIGWAQEILNSVQQNISDPQVGNILSGVAFIMDSASSEAEALYQLIK